MSTKSGLAYGEGFYLYNDLAEEGEDVYLRLDGKGICFNATPEGVVVRIPIAIWEYIRHHGGATLDLVSATDEDLQKRVETHVDERIAEYANASSKQAKALIAFAGSGVYSGADEPREVQIKEGLAFWVKERARQQEVAAKIAEYRAKEDRRGS